MTEEQEQALQLATEAGHILLENGAEISRVEETMTRIASTYGVEDESFFVLSNGIIATGQHYARADFIPIKGTQLAKVAAVNQLSRDVAAGKMSLETLGQSIQAIRSMPGKPWWELLTGIAVGVAAFCPIFGGSLLDSLATLVAGLVLGSFITFASRHLSRLAGSVAGGLVGGMMCMLVYRLAMYFQIAPQLHLANMVIGTIIALVPGVPFTNGMRDLANEDYIAGTTRLTDAFLVFLCIALGVALSIIVDGEVMGAIVQLGVPVKDAVASKWFIQLLAAFIGTVGFSVLFGAPRHSYVACGLTGTIGWAVYLWSLTGLSVVGAAFFSALAIATVSHVLARLGHQPVTIYLICGIIPLVPGGGIFWTAYYIVTNQLWQAATTGFVALKVTIAIACGIILASGVVNKFILKKRNG